MPIELTCQCGRDLYLRDELGGKQIHCPECGRTLTLPSNSKREMFNEDVPFVRPAPGTAANRSANGDAMADRADEDPRSRTRDPGKSPSRGPNGTKVIGGLAMMLAGGVMIAVTKDMCSVMKYLLVVIGFITFVRGLMGQRDDNE
jgi:hypothetical protein